MKLLIKRLQILVNIVFWDVKKIVKNKVILLTIGCFIATPNLYTQEIDSTNKVMSITSGFEKPYYNPFIRKYYKTIGPSLTIAIKIKQKTKSTTSVYLRYAFIGHRGANDTIYNYNYASTDKYYDFKGVFHLISSGFLWTKQLAFIKKLYPYILYGGELQYKYSTAQTMKIKYPSVGEVFSERFHAFSYLSLGAVTGIGVKQYLSRKITLYEQIDGSISIADYRFGMGFFDMGFPVFFREFKTVLNFQVGMSFNLN